MKDENLPVSSSSKEHILIEWKAPNRPYKKRGMQFYFNVAAIGIVILLVLFFFYQYVLIATVFSLIFVGLVITTIPPTTAHFKLTNEGLHVDESFLPWNVMKTFWPAVILKSHVCIISEEEFPKQIVLMLDEHRKDEIMTVLGKHLKETAPPKKNWFDRRSENLAKLVNLGEK